jgi:hypothetical protein
VFIGALVPASCDSTLQKRVFDNSAPHFSAIY